MCGSPQLHPLLSLGEHALSGVFPKNAAQPLTTGPLELVLCEECYLVQLAHSYNLQELYGSNYGYRSGLNASMVNHLRTKVESLLSVVDVAPGDIILDIGSNDGTTLEYFPRHARRLGMDPSAEKFRHFYAAGIELITDFFSSHNFNKHFSQKSASQKCAKIVTSISMFYDLEEPQVFVDEIASILDKNGIWHFEQSYLPLMLETTSYDTICHEHLEYYGLHQVKRMLDKAGLHILDLQFNSVNGGSFAITAGWRQGSAAVQQKVCEVLENEIQAGLHTRKPYEAFAQRVVAHRKVLREMLASLKAEGKKVFGYGASTKGNVLLQYCGLSSEDIPYIAEINEDKFGCVTPGTCIPIISEAEAKAMSPDIFLVLPWHFKENIMAREKDVPLLFPLPECKMVC